MKLAETLDYYEIGSIILVLILLFLAFKLFTQKWSYKISKPHKWDEAVKAGTISKNTLSLESVYRDKVRFYNLWFQIERLKKNNITGSFAELGVYKGETANIIHEMDTDRKLLLFDTFEGFNQNDLDKEESKEQKYSTSNFSDTSVAAVKDYIQGNDNISFYPGYFPDSTKNVEDSEFALVNLDADLYQPTLEGLKYFYPKLVKQGVILIHDYNHNWNGVRKAVDEFVKTIPESIIEIADWQGSAMIIKNSK
jgi:O-methyltransferase